jgi:Ca2+-transporting ATPase
MRPGWESLDRLEHRPPQHAHGKNNGLQSIQVATSAHVIHRPPRRHVASKSRHSAGIDDNPAAPEQWNYTDHASARAGLTFLQESLISAGSPDAEEVVRKDAPTSNQPLGNEDGEVHEFESTPADDGEEDGERQVVASDDLPAPVSKQIIQVLGSAAKLLLKVRASSGVSSERYLIVAMWLLALFSVLGVFVVSARLYALCNRSDAIKSPGLFPRSMSDDGPTRPFVANATNPWSSLHRWTDLASKCAFEQMSVERLPVADQVLLAQRFFPEFMCHLSSEMDRTPSPEVCNWAAKSLADVFLFLGLPPDAFKIGLGAEEAKSRLATHGRNVLEVGSNDVFLNALFVALVNKTSGLLLITAVLAAFLADFLDLVGLLSGVVCFAFATAAVDRYLRWCSQESSRADPMQVRCLRCKKWLWIAVAELVPGDIVRIVAGERLFADARIIAAEALWVDESLLSGQEAERVQKQCIIQPLDEIGGLAENIAYAHTDVISGSAIAVVVETGARTRIGRICKSLSQAGGVASVALRMLVKPGWRFLNSLGGPLIAFCLLMNLASFVAVGLLELQDPDKPCTPGDRRCLWLRAAQAALLISVRLIPQMLAPWCAICLYVATQNFRKWDVAIQKTDAIEPLGTCGVLCSDMSQVLTQGCLTTVGLYSSLPEPYTFEFDENICVEDGLDGVHQQPNIVLLDRSLKPRQIDADLSKSASLEAAFVKSALSFACMNCRVSAQTEQAETGVLAPGMKSEGAILALAQRHGLDPSRLWDEYPLVMDVPFSSASKLQATVHAMPSDLHSFSDLVLPPKTTHVAIVKGAPEKLLPHLMRGLSQKDRGMGLAVCSRDPDILQGLVESQNVRFASAGLRILLCAVRPLSHSEVLAMESLSDAEARLERLLQDLVFVSLLTFRDPLREQVRLGLGSCLAASIRLVMVTGEQLATAQAVAREAGISGKAQVAATLRLSCGAFRPSAEILDLCEQVNVWARAGPEEKFEITKALRELDTVCVVVAGNVDDVAILHQADVGLAFSSGQPIAKHAADAIFLDNSIACLADAIAGAKVTTANLAKAVVCWLGINVGEFLAHTACFLFGLPKPFSNLSFLLSLAITTLGVLSLCWEPADLATKKERTHHRSFIHANGRLQALVFWIALPIVLAGTMLVGFTQHVGNAQSKHIIGLCDYAWHPDVGSKVFTSMRNVTWKPDEAPYHCRCPAFVGKGSSTEQWGRQQSQENNILQEFSRYSGFSGRAYAKDQGPFRDGIENVLEACHGQLGVPDSAVCWKSQFLASAPVVRSDGTWSANATERPLFRNILLHEDWNCARYGSRIAKTMTWVSITMSEALFLQSMRSLCFLPQVFWRNLKAVASLLVAVIVCLTAIYCPVLQDTLQLAPLSLQSLLLSCIGPLGTFGLVEASKVVVASTFFRRSGDQDTFAITGV